ncbi:MAG: adenosine deaminase, partial [Candidatus Acidiferrales bacterium]
MIRRIQNHGGYFLSFLIPVLLLYCVSARGQSAAPAKPAVAHGASATERATRAFDAARSNPLALHAFLVRMPKGADLHNHLAGAVYAESWIRAGAEDNLCVDLSTLSFFKTQAMTHSIPPQPVCGEGKTPATQAFSNQHLYDALVDAFSMRSFVSSAGISGHDHFFGAFDRFRGTSPSHTGEWLDEVATRAAAQNEQYLELMETPVFSHAAAIAHEIGWNDDLSQLRDELLKRGLREEVPSDRAFFANGEAQRRAIEHCSQADTTAACHVEIRFIYQVLRGFPKEQVFAQALLGFETAAEDPQVAGINFVMPEDGYISMTDFAEQMRMVGFLHGLYPQVHITMHAGEIAPG